MTSSVRRFRRFAPFAAVAALAIVAAGCYGPGGRAAVPVTGQSDLDSEQMAAFFWANQPPGGPCLAVSVEDMTAYFAFHGNFENIRGDIAFAQSIVETGWFRYGGSVECWQNNFGGFLGKSFSSAETGVRAQIQHLRAYSDPSATSCTQPPLHTPCADPVFSSVNPKGKAPNWNDMGNGNWAEAPDYASKVLTVYNQMRAYVGLPEV